MASLFYRKNTCFNFAGINTYLLEPSFWARRIGRRLKRAPVGAQLLGDADWQAAQVFGVGCSVAGCS